MTRGITNSGQEVADVKIDHRNGSRLDMKKINSFDIVHGQYLNIKEKLKSTRDMQEKNVLFRRLVNLLGVMQFLISINKPHMWTMKSGCRISFTCHFTWNTDRFRKPIKIPFHGKSPFWADIPGIRRNSERRGHAGSRYQWRLRLGLNRRFRLGGLHEIGQDRRILLPMLYWMGIRIWFLWNLQSQTSRAFGKFSYMSLSQETQTSVQLRSYVRVSLAMQFHRKCQTHPLLSAYRRCGKRIRFQKNLLLKELISCADVNPQSTHGNRKNWFNHVKYQTNNLLFTKSCYQSFAHYLRQFLRQLIQYMVIKK